MGCRTNYNDDVGVSMWLEIKGFFFFVKVTSSQTQRHDFYRVVWLVCKRQIANPTAIQRLQKCCAR